jgi:hypothetical protein
LEKLILRLSVIGLAVACFISVGGFAQMMQLDYPESEALAVDDIDSIL